MGGNRWKANEGWTANMGPWDYSHNSLRPHRHSNCEIKDSFEDKLTDTLSNISQRKEIILLGDFNARTGKKNYPVVGNFAEATANNNGNPLVEACQTFGLKILNGFFQHREIHKYTWNQPTRQLRSIIDYAIVKQATLLNIQDIRVCRGAECGTDHYLLKMTLHLLHMRVHSRVKDEKDKGELSSLT